MTILPSKKKRWLEIALLTVAVLVVVLFYAWTVRTSITEWPRVHGHEDDYSNLLSRGFLSGHLNLKKNPPSELINAIDPYDPVKRPATGLMHDVSYYKGKYYLYWGPAPVVTLFLPFRIIFGLDLPQVYGNLLFVSVGFGASVLLWLAVRRKYFPESGVLVSTAGVLILGCCGMTLSLLRRPSLWELPISSGYAYAMLGLACVYGGLQARKPVRWWLAAGLTLGLAVASRPTYVFAAGLMLLVIAWARWRHTDETGKKSGFACAWWREMLALGCPFGAIVGGLLIYNYARFDHPLEFGLKYQLTGARELNATHFSPRFAAFNAFIYYLAPAQWSRYFPFVQFIRSRPLPADYYGIEYPYGLLINMPVTLLAFFWPLGMGRRGPGEKETLGYFLLGLTVFYLGVGVFLLGFWAGTQRYMADFTPSLMLLACFGLLGLERWLQSLRGFTHGLGHAVWISAAVFSVFFGVMASFQLHGLFRLFSPDRFSRLAYCFNYPTYLVEKMLGTLHGPLEMDMRFPKGRTGKVEPLVSTGWEFYSDQVFVYYVDDHRIRLGFDHLGRGSRISDPVEIDYDALHHLHVEMGSLYPVSEHPFFAGKTDIERVSLTRCLRLTLDNHVVMEGVQPFYEGSPGSVQIGGNTNTLAYGERFTGQISNIHRGSYQFVSEPRGVYGAVTLKLMFPRGLNGRSQPLVGAGQAGRADTLYVHYVRDGVVRFGYDHWGVGAWDSEEVTFDPERDHTLDICMPALISRNPLSEYSPLSQRVLLRLDGKVVWQAPLPGYVVSSAVIAMGRNFAGSSTCEAEFSGAISSVSRSTDIKEPANRSVAGARLHLIFPSERDGQREPLLSRGGAAGSDLVYVHYLDGQHIGFGVDHRGFPTTESPPVALDLGAEHDVGINFKAVEGGTVSGGPGELSVIVDGREVWKTDATFYPADPETVVIGFNRVGANSCGPAFNGSLLRLEFPK